MEISDRRRGDLRTLSRPVEESARASGSSVNIRSTVPAPTFKWKTRVLVPGAILLALLLLLGYAARDLVFPARKVSVVPVVVKAGSGIAGEGASSGSAGGASVQAPGWVEADPFPISVAALSDGIVKEVLALEGQSIKAGDVVARLVDDDAKLSLARADADLAEKQAKLDAAQRNWDNPTERVRAVASSEAMVAETKADLQKLSAEVKTEEAKLASMKLEAERMAEAFKTRASSEIETFRTQQLYEAQKAVVEATQAREPVLKAQLAQRVAEETAAKEHLRLRIDDARMLAEAKAQVDLSKAARDEATLRLSRMEVRSPVDGIVMQRLTEPGAKLVMNMDDVHSSHAVRLYDPKRLQVRVDVPLADAAKVGVGQGATIVVGVLPDKQFAGKVTRIVNEADIQKNTLQVKVAIVDPTIELKPEMLARVRFAPAAATTQPGASSGGAQVVFAPLELIHRMGDMSMAWVVDPRKGIASHRMIQIGQTQQDGWVAVTSGLSHGDQLIANYEGLKDGQRVRVRGEATLTQKSPDATKGASHGAH